MKLMINGKCQEKPFWNGFKLLTSLENILIKFTTLPDGQLFPPRQPPSCLNTKKTEYNHAHNKREVAFLKIIKLAKKFSRFFYDNVRILCFFAIIKKLKSFSKQQKQTRRIRIL
jgi:hypothetical protein